MMPPVDGLITIAVTFMVIGLLVMTQLPKEWQTPGGYAIVTLGGIPAALVLVIIFIQPWALAGLLFCFGVWCAAKAR